MNQVRVALRKSKPKKASKKEKIAPRIQYMAQSLTEALNPAPLKGDPERGL